MSMGDQTGSDFINAAYLGTDTAWRPVAGQASLHVALHTADPGEGGTQQTA